METKSIKIGYAPKTVALADGTYLQFYYANNKGRGGDNVTIDRCSDANRTYNHNAENVIATTRTSSWKGNVNFSKYVQECLGL